MLYENLIHFGLHEEILVLFDVEVEEKRKELVKMQVRKAERQRVDADRCQKYRNLLQISSFTSFCVSFSTFQEMNDGLVDDLNTKGCFWHDSQISF